MAHPAHPNDPVALAALLSAAGFVAADEEADELLACAAGLAEPLDSLVARRLAGEPLAWITGRVSFCGLEIVVHPGVYVPRWQSEELARRALDRLPAGGTAIDLCTGAGAVAKVLATGRPGGYVVASDIDTRAVACAAANGVEVFHGDLFAPLPPLLEGSVDVVVGIVPYVPTPALPLLPHDTLTFESTRSYDGGNDGTDVLRRVLADSPYFLRGGGRCCSNWAASRPTCWPEHSNASGTSPSPFFSTRTAMSAALRRRWASSADTPPMWAGRSLLRCRPHSPPPLSAMPVGHEDLDVRS